MFLNEFERLCLEKASAPTAAKANACHDELLKLAAQMVKADKILELRELLKHENSTVRCSAAYALLPFATQEAEEVLDELGKGRGAIPYEAFQTLMAWRIGELKFEHYKN